GLLGPAAGMLVRPLGEIWCDPDRDPMIQANAAEALAELLKDGSKGQALEYLHGVLNERVDDPAAELAKNRLASRQAAAATGLAALGDPEPLGSLLAHRPDPRLRSLLIQRLAAGGLPLRVVLERLAQPLADPIERQALLLACAEAPRAKLHAVE